MTGSTFRRVHSASVKGVYVQVTQAANGDHLPDQQTTSLVCVILLRIKDVHMQPAHGGYHLRTNATLAHIETRRVIDKGGVKPLQTEPMKVLCRGQSNKHT